MQNGLKCNALKAQCIKYAMYFINIKPWREEEKNEAKKYHHKPFQ